MIGHGDADDELSSSPCLGHIVAPPRWRAWAMQRPHTKELVMNAYQVVCKGVFIYEGTSFVAACNIAEEWARNTGYVVYVEDTLTRVCLRQYMWGSAT